MGIEVETLLVDDEPDVTRGLVWLLDSVGVKARAFNSGQNFITYLAQCKNAACAVLDLRMPGLSGVELLEQALKLRPDLAVIFLTAHGDVPSAVKAMKLGAFDFLQKPFNPQHFIECVNQAGRRASERHDHWRKRCEYDACLAKLSTREREVFDQLVVGASSKEIGRNLDISHKTVDVHRANILRKLEVSSARELGGRFRIAEEPA